MNFDPLAAGWSLRPACGFFELLGPLWTKRDESGRAYGFLAEPRHLNPVGIVHGGMLVTLADQALSAIAWEAAERTPCVTIQLDTHFVASVSPGEFVEARGRAVRRTRSVVFVQGALSVGRREVMTATGVWKVLEAK
jgi:uncharacterized protein (TIGR00369 family)